MATVTSKQILDAAARDIGYHEGPNKHNKFGEWFGLDGVPWCMEAVQYWYHEAGADLPHKTASCGDLLRWYREHQPECVTEDPVPGCIVIMDFPGGAPTDHAGVFVKLVDRKLTTIDGNTSGVNDASGGWVQQRTRTVDYARPVYIVPHELREHTMIRYDTMSEIKAAFPWAVPTIDKLIRAGALTGTSGWYDGDGYPTGLDLSEDMIRTFVICDRAGAYDN